MSDEIKVLRQRAVNAESRVRELEASIEGDPSWLQAKNARQRAMLRRLTQRVTAQRIVLRVLSETGRGPDEDDWVKIREMLTEELDAELVKAGLIPE